MLREGNEIIPCAKGGIAFVSEQDVEKTHGDEEG